jgi:hypothetical protein
MSQCHVCGMVYSKGQPADEKLHKQQHQVYTQGMSLQVGHGRGSQAAGAGIRIGCTAMLHHHWMLLQ